MTRSRAVLPLSAVNQVPGPGLFPVVANTLAPLVRLFTSQDWRGGDNVPRTGPVIIVSNHVSHYDPISLGHFIIWHGRWPRFMAKADLWRVPGLSWLLSNLGHIPVERNTARAKNSLVAAEAALGQGRCVVIYPEGTVTKDPDTWPMTARPGVVRLALSTGAPVVPVAQWGPQAILPKGDVLPRLFPRKTVQALAGKPIHLADLAEVADTPTALAEGSVRIMDALAALVGELRGEPVPDERFDLRAGRRLPRDWAGEASRGADLA